MDRGAPRPGVSPTVPVAWVSRTVDPRMQDAVRCDGDGVLSSVRAKRLQLHSVHTGEGSARRLWDRIPGGVPRDLQE